MLLLADLYSAEHEYIGGGHKSSFVFSQILQLHTFFIYIEYIHIFIFSLHSMVADALGLTGQWNLGMPPMRRHPLLTQGIERCQKECECRWLQWKVMAP